MAKKEKNVSAEDSTKVKDNTKAKEAKESLTIASLFQKFGQKGTKDRKELATKIIKYLSDKGVTRNIKGRLITEARVSQQISAMVRDVKMKRGEATGAWWSTFTVEEDKTNFKLVPVEASA